MRKKRDASTLATERRQTTDEVDGEILEDQQPRGEFQEKPIDEPERQEWIDDGDRRPRVPRNIRSQDAGYCAGSSDHWDQGGWVDEDLGQRGKNAAQQVENRVAKMSEGVFDVVPENPQIQHVAANMGKPRGIMHEHAGENGRQRFDGMMNDNGRHEAPLQEQFVRPNLGASRSSDGHKGLHPDECANVEGDEDPVDDGRTPSRQTIANREHVGALPRRWFDRRMRTLVACGRDRR